MSRRPNIDFMTSLIAYESSNPQSYMPYVQNLRTFFSLYEEVNIKPQDGFATCENGVKTPDNPELVCKFYPIVLESCVKENNYGYDRSEPCVVIKINKVSLKLSVLQRILLILKFLDAWQINSEVLDWTSFDGMSYLISHPSKFSNNIYLTVRSSSCWLDAFFESHFTFYGRNPLQSENYCIFCVSSDTKGFDSLSRWTMNHGLKITCSKLTFVLWCLHLNSYKNMGFGVLITTSSDRAHYCAHLSKHLLIKFCFIDRTRIYASRLKSTQLSTSIACLTLDSESF